jgi:hypothetical protein
LTAIILEIGPSSFNGLAAILLKMVPYTAAQLTTYELATSTIYSIIPKASPLLFSATVFCAAVAAVVSVRFCLNMLLRRHRFDRCLLSVDMQSLVSQPGDAILSELNNGGSPDRTIRDALVTLGPTGLFRGTQVISIFCFEN